MLERSRVAELVNMAPIYARRESGPDILVADQIELGGTIGHYGIGRVDDVKSYLTNLQESARLGKVGVVHVDAKEYLYQAIDTPKHSLDKNSFWIVNTPKEIIDVLVNHRYRKDDRDDPYGTAWKFRHNSDNWSSEIYRKMDNGFIWEYGVVVSNEQGKSIIISLSVPWDGRRLPVHESLTPEQIFIGREDILEDFMVAVTGKTQRQRNLEDILNADHTKAWRDDLKISGLEQHVKTRNFRRREFSDVIAKEIELRLGAGHKATQDFITQATDVRGYYITASEGNIPGTVNRSLYVDDSNWLNTGPKREFTPTEIGDKPDTWVYSGGCMYNSSDDLSVCVFLAKPEFIDPNRRVESTAVSGIEITRKFTGANGKKKRVDYHLNHKKLGDSYFYLEGLSFLREENAKQITPIQMERLLGFFETAVSRGTRDSYTDGPEGLALKTQTILKNARMLIEDKVKVIGQK